MKTDPPWSPAPVNLTAKPFVRQGRPGKRSNRDSDMAFYHYCHHRQCSATIPARVYLDSTISAQTVVEVRLVRSSGRRGAGLRSAPYWAGSVQCATVRQIKPNHESCIHTTRLENINITYSRHFTHITGIYMQLFTPCYASLLESSPLSKRSQYKGT